MDDPANATPTVVATGFRWQRRLLTVPPEIRPGEGTAPSVPDAATVEAGDSLVWTVTSLEAVLADGGSRPIAGRTTRSDGGDADEGSRVAALTPCDVSSSSLVGRRLADESRGSGNTRLHEGTLVANLPPELDPEYDPLEARFANLAVDIDAVFDETPDREGLPDLPSRRTLCYVLVREAGTWWYLLVRFADLAGLSDTTFESLFTGPAGARARRVVINSQVPDGTLSAYLSVTGRLAEIDPGIPDP